MSKYNFLVPTLTEEQTDVAVEQLQIALDVLNDLALTLKHAHWNVTGPNFIAVHEMLDPQIDEVRGAVDTIAERIATLGGDPCGLCCAVCCDGCRDVLPEYPVKGRAATEVHLKALDEQYVAVCKFMREAIAKLDEADVISSNVLQDALQGLEQFQWFVRSHLI
ncbi:MAG: DNA starvation/stationary phase protection protein [Candidatus Ancillula sp.]|jgi:starvation-inducible DNA-binding protein|nr:DNA starvation/stationary phase protection protein [Candidatus Ancillula sp.]